MIEWSKYYITDKEKDNYYKIITQVQEISKSSSWKGLIEYKDYEPGFLFNTKMCWSTDKLPNSYKKYLDSTYILSCHFYPDQKDNTVCYIPSGWSCNHNGELKWTTIRNTHYYKKLSEPDILSWVRDCLTKEKEKFSNTIDIIETMEKPLQDLYKSQTEALLKYKKLEQIMLKKININKDTGE